MKFLFNIIASVSISWGEIKGGEENVFGNQGSDEPFCFPIPLSPLPNVEKQQYKTIDNQASAQISSVEKGISGILKKLENLENCISNLKNYVKGVMEILEKQIISLENSLKEIGVQQSTINTYLKADDTPQEEEVLNSYEERKASPKKINKSPKRPNTNVLSKEQKMEKVKEILSYMPKTFDPSLTYLNKKQYEGINLRINKSRSIWLIENTCLAILMLRGISSQKALEFISFYQPSQSAKSLRCWLGNQNMPDFKNMGKDFYISRLYEKWTDNKLEEINVLTNAEQIKENFEAISKIVNVYKDYQKITNAINEIKSPGNNNGNPRKRILEDPFPDLQLNRKKHKPLDSEGAPSKKPLPSHTVTASFYLMDEENAYNQQPIQGDNPPNSSIFNSNFGSPYPPVKSIVNSDELTYFPNQQPPDIRNQYLDETSSVLN